MSQTDALDELARYNKQQWEELAGAGVAYSLPALDLDESSAWRLIDPQGVLVKRLGKLSGRDVLCLAAGGGQQSVAFALLGANVTVLDLSETQLARDRLAAAHYGVDIDIVQGDMRNLQCFDDDSFDVVFQAYSINFVPSVQPVHFEVARVLRKDGVYRVEWSNPFTQTVDDTSWTGSGYVLSETYEDGLDLTERFPHWDVTGPDGEVRKIASPHEYVHALSSMVNSLVTNGFVIVQASEDAGSEPDPEPGTWSHFIRVAVPYLTLWCLYLPGVVEPSQ